MIKYVIYVFIFLIGLSTSYPDHFRYQNFIGLSVINLYFSYLIYRKFNFLLSILFFYFSIHMIYFYSYPYTPYIRFDFGSIKYLKSLAASTHIYYISLLSLLYLNIKWRKYVSRGLLYLGGYSSLLFIFNYFRDNYPTSILKQSSMDACYIALCTTQFYKFKHKTYYWIVFGLAVLLSNSSSAYLMYIVSLLLQNFKNKYSFLIIILLIGLSIKMDLNLLNFNGREQIWDQSIRYFISSGSIWTGLGPGSFEFFGPLIENKDTWEKYGGYIFLHNDFLQIIFEYGLLGSILFLYLILYLISKSNKYQINFIIISSIYMFNFFPLRYLIPSLFLLIYSLDILEPTRRRSINFT